MCLFLILLGRLEYCYLIFYFWFSFVKNVKGRKFVVGKKLVKDKLEKKIKILKFLKLFKKVIFKKLEDDK